MFIAKILWKMAPDGQTTVNILLKSYVRMFGPYLFNQRIFIKF